MNEYPQNESETFSDLTSAAMTSTTFVKPEISKSEVSMATKTAESVVSMATDLYLRDDCGKQETSDIFSMAASIFYQDNGDPSFSSGFSYEPNYVYLSNVDISVQGQEQQGSQQFCQNESVNSINYQYPGNNSSSDEQNFGGQNSQNFISSSSQIDSYSGSYGNDVASSNQGGMFNQGCDSNGISQGEGHNQWSFNPGFIHSYGNGIRSSDLNQQQEFWMQSQQSFSGNMGFVGHGNVHLPFDNGGLNFSANMNQSLAPFSQVQPYGNPFGGNVAGYGIVPGQQSVPAFSENERSFNTSFVPNSSHYPIPPNGVTGKNESKTSSDSPKGSQRSRNSDSDKPYDCTNCGKSFKSEWSLKRHALVHSGEKPYKCNMCDQRYARSDKLRSHLRIHNVIDTKIDIKAFRDTTRTRTSKKARKDSQQIQAVINVGQNNVTCIDESAQGGPLPNFSQVFSPPETVISNSELAITRGFEVQNNNTNSDNCVLPTEESISLKEEISRKEDDLENTGKVKDMSWHESESRNEKSVVGIENKTITEVFLKTNVENPAQGNESSCLSQNKGQTKTVAGTQGESFLLFSGCDSILADKKQPNCKPLSIYVPEKNESSCSSNSGGCELPNDKNHVPSLENSKYEAKRTNKMKNTKEEQVQNFKGKHGTINNATFLPLEQNTNQEVGKSSPVKVETDKHGSSQKHESVIKVIQEVISKIKQESTSSTPDEHLESSVLTKGLTLHEIDKNFTPIHVENNLGRYDPDGVQNSKSNQLSQNNFNSHRNAINLLGSKKPNTPDGQENITKLPNEKCASLCYDQECTSNPRFVMQVLTDQNKYVPEMKMMSQQNKCNLKAGVNPVTQNSVNTLSFGLGLLNPESIGNPDFGLDMLSEHDINNAESELGLTAQKNETDLHSGFGLFNQQGIENANPRYVMLNPEGIDEADCGFSGITQENEIKTIIKTFDLNPAEIRKVHSPYPPMDPDSLCKSLGSAKTIDQTRTTGKKSTSSKKRKKYDKKDVAKQNFVIASASNLDDGSVVKDRGEPKMPRKRKAKEAHSCDVCGRLFTQKGSVIRHQLVHSGEKPFECDVCSIKFARIDNLRAHKKTHGIFESWNTNQKEETVILNMGKRRSKRHGKSDIKKVNSSQNIDLKTPKGKCDEYKTGQQCKKFEVITGENQEVHPDIVTISTAINYEAGHSKDLLVKETATDNNLKEIHLSHRHKELSQQITPCSPAENNFFYQNVVEKGKSSNKGSIKNNQVVKHMGNTFKQRKKDGQKKVSVTRNCQKYDLDKKMTQNHKAIKHIRCKEVLRETRTVKSVTDKNLKKSGNICHCDPNSQSLGLSIIWQKSYICSVCHVSFVNLCSTWNHMLSHTKQDSSICEICSKTFQSAHKLKCHLLKHIFRGKERCKCVYCGFDSQSSRGLRNFTAAGRFTREIKFARQKQKQFVSSMKVAEANCYKCMLCGKQFLWHSYLRFHLLGHEEKLSLFGKTWRKKSVKVVCRSQGGKIYKYLGLKGVGVGERAHYSEIPREQPLFTLEEDVVANHTL
ncbi:hypothetical protein CHS0354_002537 [Potamilus streckersoni]|uniref:C2H2-type domain-containing protein n=1 Tax=Potamilus streckersoni TaxID=2493646 RepID=A0AAE0VQF8_9BIVA|nr:hypothetical protein CHS0354_002537 [Potamilus streckersoni]